MNRTFTMSALKALRALGIAVLISGCSALNANNSNPKFRVIAFFTAKQDHAHISFVHEATNDCSASAKSSSEPPWRA